jgi:hypothetical protein
MSLALFPNNGRFIKEDGTAVNIANLLAGSTRSYITEPTQLVEGKGILIGFSFTSKNEANLKVYDEIVNETPTETKRLIPDIICDSDNEAVFIFPPPHPFSEGLYIDPDTLDYIIVHYLAEEES